MSEISLSRDLNKMELSSRLLFGLVFFFLEEGGISKRLSPGTKERKKKSPPCCLYGPYTTKLFCLVVFLNASSGCSDVTNTKSLVV